MKAIYTFLNNNIYRIDQDTSEPKVLAPAPSSEHSSINADTVLKKVTASVFLNTMETVNIKSNKELYNAMKNTIKEKQITSIETIYDRYMMLTDYQLFDSSCEICHNVVTKPVSAKDAALLLGVALNNELVYRRVKMFDPIIEFATANQLPLGIMKSADTNYKFKINDISIYQDKFPSSVCNCNNSVYCTPYSVNAASTVTDVLSDYIKIYSTAAAGLDISEIDINFIPKTIDLKINLTMANLIVAYDDSDIITLIQEVIAEKYNPKPDPEPPIVGPDDEGSLFPVDREHKPSDGDYAPDKDGWYDFYERCLSTNPGALLVVEDLIPDSVYRPKTMIRKHLLLKDIPDIQVGEYVRYMRAHDETHKHGCHHHHHHCDDDIHVHPIDDNVNGDNDDETLDNVDGSSDSSSDTTDDKTNIPSAQDRGASLDNTDSDSNIVDNMNGFTMVDLNEILL